MSKYSFLIYHKEYHDFLNGLRDLGVVHIIEKERGEIQDEELSEKYSLVNRLTAAIKYLRKIETEKQSPDANLDAIEILEKIEKLQAENEDLHQPLTSLQKEITQLEPWGNFSIENIKRLEENHLYLKLYTCSSSKYSIEWEDTYNIEIINHAGGLTYFALLHKEGETVELDAEEIRIPDKSLTELQSVKNNLKKETKKNNNTFTELAETAVESLETKRSEIIQEIDYQNVVLNTKKEAEEKLMILEGWVPEEKIEDLESYLQNSGVYFESKQPTEKEKPPIKLKNSKFAKLFEPIGDLYTLPSYKELDLTPFFAPFFMMFFGFCLGDAGYGLLILLATIILRFKVKKELKPVMTLGMYLGIATVIMGIISGTFFGIFLNKVEVAWLKKYKELFLDQDQLMYLAVGVGILQIIFGMFLKASNIIKFQGLKYAYSTIGWIIILLGGIVLTGGKYLGFIEQYVFKTGLIIIGIIGAIPVFLLNSPGKNFFLNIGLGIWDTYGMASGLLGDALSYIRLFALGISSAVLGNVFNQLALELSPEQGIAKFIVMILILLFGHSLNLFMAALGSFVHPLRLTFVEFYKNVGFTGGGKRYSPFKKYNI